MSSEQAWLQVLDNPTLTVLPHDYLRPQEEPFTEPKEYSFQIPQLDLPNNTLSDKYLIALSAWATLVYRLSGDDDIVLYIANNNVLRFTIQPTWTFQDLYNEISNQITEINKLADICFDSLSESIKAEKDLDKCPQLFRLAFQTARILN